jgi:hypothetical protein
MLVRLSLALLLSLLVSTPSYALLVRRVIEHRMMGNAFSAAACRADAARACVRALRTTRCPNVSCGIRICSTLAAQKK